MGTVHDEWKEGREAEGRLREDTRTLADALRWPART